MSEQVKLEYKDLIRMIDSPDKENAIVALECLSNVDFESNLVLVLCLFKNSKVPESFWIDNANSLYNKIKDLDIGQGLSTRCSSITNRNILEKAKSLGVGQEQIALFIEVINYELTNSLKEYGYDFIKSITVEINT